MTEIWQAIPGSSPERTGDGKVCLRPQDCHLPMLLLRALSIQLKNCTLIRARDRDMEQQGIVGSSPQRSGLAGKVCLRPRDRYLPRLLLRALSIQLKNRTLIRPRDRDMGEQPRCARVFSRGGNKRHLHRGQPYKRERPRRSGPKEAPMPRTRTSRNLGLFGVFPQIRVRRISAPELYRLVYFCVLSRSSLRTMV